MGRKRTTNTNLLDRMSAVRKPNGKVYYYYDTGGQPRYKPLGSDYLEAVRIWRDLHMAESPAAIQSLAYAIQKYSSDVIPTKAERTQVDNKAEIKKLLEFFEGARLEDIRPLHIRQYREWRTAKTRCNRELALLSHIWNMAREWGLTDLPNPCAGVKRNKEVGRDAYITDEQFSAILACAEPVLADAMELAYLTGQRPADVLKMRETDIREGCIEVKQGKTGAKLRIEAIGRLGEVIARCKSRKAGNVYNTALITGKTGKPISVQWIGELWNRAKAAAGIEGDIQFRDIRAKTVSDKEEITNIRDAQQLAGHSTVGMTETYSRKRRGQKITPLK